MKMPSSAKNPDNYELTVITSSVTGLEATMPLQFVENEDQEMIDWFVAEAHNPSPLSRATSAALALRAVDTD